MLSHCTTPTNGSHFHFACRGEWHTAQGSAVETDDLWADRLWYEMLRRRRAAAQAQGSGRFSTGLYRALVMIEIATSLPYRVHPGEANPDCYQALQ